MMNLDNLFTRKAQLMKAIEDTTQSVFILRGHLAEVDFQISELQKPVDETPVEQSVESVVE